jgi:hypothetical protein
MARGVQSYAFRREAVAAAHPHAGRRNSVCEGVGPCVRNARRRTLTPEGVTLSGGGARLAFSSAAQLVNVVIKVYQIAGQRRTANGLPLE